MVSCELSGVTVCVDSATPVRESLRLKPTRQVAPDTTARELRFPLRLTFCLLLSGINFFFEPLEVLVEQINPDQ